MAIEIWFVLVRLFQIMKIKFCFVFLFVLSFSFAKKSDVIKLIKQSQQIPVFYYSEGMMARPTNDVCKANYEVLPTPIVYGNLQEGLVRNLNIGYKTDQFVTAQSLFTIDTFPDKDFKVNALEDLLDSTIVIFAVAELQLHYVTEPDFSANVPGKYTTHLMGKMLIHYYKTTPKGIKRVGSILGYEVAKVMTESIQHRACIPLMEDYPDVVAVNEVLIPLETEIPNGIFEMSQKHWKKYK